jgi:transcriptional regulator with GAF, ATPase, and Fis domain
MEKAVGWWRAGLVGMMVLTGRARAFLRSLFEQPVMRCRVWIVLAAMLVCAYALGVLGYVVLTPEIGVRCAFSRVVGHFYEDFLYPAGQEPLREGDRIVQVGEEPVETWAQLLRKMLSLRADDPQPADGLTADDLRAGRAPAAKTHLVLDGRRLVRVTYQRPGEEGTRSVWCRLGRSPVETLIPSSLWFFLKIGLFVVGAIVYWKRPEDRPAARFFCLCIVSFGAYLGGYHWARIVTQPVLILVFMVCALLLPAVTLHFYLVFPRPKAFLERWPRLVLLGLYGPPVLFLLLLLSNYLRIRLLHHGGPAGEPEIEIMLYEIYLYFRIAALYYLASVLSLIHSYQTAGNTTERNQVKCILLGSVAAGVPIGYSLYLAFWEQGRFGGGAATWPMFFASVFVTAAYIVSITRYRLMQVDQIVSSGVVYFLISSLAGLLYYGLVFAGVMLVGSHVGEGPSLGQVLAVSTTVLVLTATLDLIRGRFMRALNRHFRREKHQLDRTLQQMSRAIGQLVDPTTLARRLLLTAAELLGVPRGAVYLRRGDPPLYHLTDALGPAPALSELSSGCPLVEALRGHGTVGPPLAPAAAVSAPAQRQLHFVGGTVAQALLHEGQLLGLLVLGPKEGGAYTSEDFNLLSAFAQITVLALVSAEGHRTIETLNGELKDKVEKIAEQQRRILALQSQLSAARETAPSSNGVGAQEENGSANNGTAHKEDKSLVCLTGEPRSLVSVALPDGIVGSSAQVRSLMQLVRRVAASSSAVLLRGESGTGKELLARALHEHSPRAGKPFVKVHCAALSAGLLESELFGHVKGAFTSAIRDKVGRFEAADGGTLFLDEIGDINLEVQTKLLRVLEEMTFERVGSSEPVQVDVRVLAATHQDLEALMRQGRFREDLFFRLNVLPIALPPLRERAEDVPELVMYFLHLYGGRASKEMSGIDDDALALLKGYRWPGNVRELENYIARAVVIADRPVITAADLPPEVRAAAPAEVESPDGATWPSEGDLPELASVLQTERAGGERRERDALLRALAAAGGNKARAARALGLARSTLVSKLKKYGLS